VEVRFVNSRSGVLRDRRNPIRIKQGIVAQRLDVGPHIFCLFHSSLFLPLTIVFRSPHHCAAQALYSFLVFQPPM
jgi:hypothetical protein